METFNNSELSSALVWKGIRKELFWYRVSNVPRFDTLYLLQKISSFINYISEFDLHFDDFCGGILV